MKWERRNVDPVGYTAVRVVKDIREIPVWITYFGEDEEMKYYLTDFTEGAFWGVIKEVEK